MQSTEIGQPIELWAMDVLGPLPMTARGNQNISTRRAQLDSQIAPRRASDTSRREIDGRTSVTSRGADPIT